MPMNGIDAYRVAQLRAASPQDALASAFSQAALRLMEATRRPGDYATYAKALEFNRVLWTLIQADVAERAANFAADVRDDILSLSVFVDRHTIGALARPNPKSLEALIVIDRNLARGLAA